MAIKFLHQPICCTDAATKAKFMKEVDLLKACRSRNVVEFLGAWVQEVRLMGLQIHN